MVDFCADDTPALQAWRVEVRQFLEQALPGGMTFDFDYDEDPAGWAPYLAFWRKVGEKGWVSLTWPEEYYGLGRTAIERWILHEEFCDYGVPSYPVIGLHVARALLRLGTPEQRRRHLKGIADVTTFWAEGYSEPGAGSDLAALTTQARRDGEGWILNGQKTLGTAAQHCQWMSVLARTDPEARTHAGITCFLVPLDSPGVQILPLVNMAGGQQNQTFFDNVRLPADSVLGSVGGAWNEIWFGQGGERLDPLGPPQDLWQFRTLRMLNQIIQYCRTTHRGGILLSEDPEVRRQLGELIMGVELMKLYARDAYSNAASGAPRTRALPQIMSDVHFKEFWPRMAQICMEIVGPLAQAESGPGAALHGRVERYYRASFGNHAGGTSQLKRMVLATRGLGLPR